SLVQFEKMIKEVAGKNGVPWY
nr:RecName: Full=Phospholipase A2 crotoxin basic chain; Short=CB; Short=svPLA2; AltName: Full=Cdcum6; AltName: Full=Phosphatidylcholine 2-acylhydrolase [Crotalus durissus cumanensis]